MCLLSNLTFPLDKGLNLPPLATSYIRCTPLPDSSKDSSFVPTNLPFENSPVVKGKVLSAKLLAEGKDVKTAVEIVLGINGESFEYLPGDTIGILPQNPKAEVDSLLERLHLPDVCYNIEVDLESQKKKSSLPSHIPSRSDPKFLFTNCLDLRAVVKKTLLRSLLEHTSNECEKRRLTELCSREGSMDYNSLILNRRCSLLDILNVFPSCQPPLSLLLEYLPRLQPRPYSISSSPLEHPDRIKIIFNVVFDDSGKRGVCSGWLYDLGKKFFDISDKLSSLNLSEDSTDVVVPLYLRKPTQFRIPEDPSVPLIMIGTGTGIAPFLGFLEHRKHQLGCQSSTIEKVLNNWLLFGCRYPVKDEIYRDVLSAYDRDNLCRCLVSFSRAEKDNTFRYVQDILTHWENEIVNQLLETDSRLFICGNGLKMSKQIVQHLTECISRVKVISAEEATKRAAELEKNGRILKDVWV